MADSPVRQEQNLCEYKVTSLRSRTRCHPHGTGLWIRTGPATAADVSVIRLIDSLEEDPILLWCVLSVRACRQN